MASSLRRALVTGASSGIGAAIALRLLADGYHVAVLGRSLARLEAAFPASDRLYPIEADLTTAAGCASAVERSLAALSGGLDVLVNNAGHGDIGQQLGGGFDVAAFDALFALNVRAPTHLIHLLADVLSAARGVVVNISSIAAQRPFNGMVPYCMSKAAVDMLTQGAAIELAPRGVRVVGVAPGTIATTFHENAGMTAATAAAYYAASASTHPIGRVGTAADIADAVAYLVDPRAGFVTGATLVVDGGRLLTSSTAPQLSGGAK